ncbi:hypothetical protein JL475_39185, partial [Streptomyces sp. M2CJ-2]|nr:hypothetical protein [Streptomyces sp. M2CJ-2]
DTSDSLPGTIISKIIPGRSANVTTPCAVVELDGMAPASRGAVFADGWDEGVTAVSEALARIADRDGSWRGGRGR